MAQSPKHPASEHHFLASAHHQAAAHHHLQAAHLHDLGQHEAAKEHATQLPTAIFGAPIGGEAPDFRAPLPGSPISESMSSWNGLICSA